MHICRSAATVALVFEEQTSQERLYHGRGQGWLGLRGLEDAVGHGVVSDGRAIQQHHSLRKEYSQGQLPARKIVPCACQAPVLSTHAAHVSL